jgi:hypothetical protein
MPAAFLLLFAMCWYLCTLRYQHACSSYMFLLNSSCRFSLVFTSMCGSVLYSLIVGLCVRRIISCGSMLVFSSMCGSVLCSVLPVELRLTLRLGFCASVYFSVWIYIVCRSFHVIALVLNWICASVRFCVDVFYSLLVELRMCWTLRWHHFCVWMCCIHFCWNCASVELLVCISASVHFSVWICCIHFCWNCA